MKQDCLFPELMSTPVDDETDRQPPVRRPPRPRPKLRFRRPPELFPEHAARMRRLVESQLRAARIAADRSALGTPGRRPMVRNPVSALVCVVRREVWGSRPALAASARVTVQWIQRLERESWSGRVIDELASEHGAADRLRRLLGIKIVELIDLEEGRLDIADALSRAKGRATAIKAKWPGP